MKDWDGICSTTHIYSPEKVRALASRERVNPIKFDGFHYINPPFQFTNPGGEFGNKMQKLLTAEPWRSAPPASQVRGAPSRYRPVNSFVLNRLDNRSNLILIYRNS